MQSTRHVGFDVDRKLILSSRLSLVERFFAETIRVAV